MGEGNAKRDSVAWSSSVSTLPSSAWSGGGKAKEENDDGGGGGDDEGDRNGRDARGQMSCSSESPAGASGTPGVVVGGTGFPPVQDQPVENNGVVGGAGAGTSHSDSAWSDIASRRYLRMRDAAAAARADEGKAGVVSGEEEDSEDSEENDELEDIVWRGGVW